MKHQGFTTWIPSLALCLFGTVCLPREAVAQTIWHEVRRPRSERLPMAIREARGAVRASRRAQQTPYGHQLGSQALDHSLLAPAFQELKSALEEEPDNVMGLVALAEILGAMDRADEAIVPLVHARQAVGEGPALVDVLFRLGTVLTQLRRFEEAREAYDTLVKLPEPAASRSVAMCNLAEVYMYLRDMDRSVDMYRGCVALEPRNSSGWWGLSVAYDRAGMGLDAQVTARNALAVDPAMRDIQSVWVFFVPSYEVHYYLGLGLEAQDKPLLAAREWAEFIEASADEDSWRLRAVGHLERCARNARALDPMAELPATVVRLNLRVGRRDAVVRSRR